MIDISRLATGEEDSIVPLIREAFDTHISVNYSTRGIIEFYKYIDIKAIKERLSNNHEIFVARTDNKIVGIVELRGSSHIALLFVKNEIKGSGVGKALLHYIVDKLKAEQVRQITVNSSPNSVGFYASQGFIPVGEEEESQGIRSVRMQLTIQN